MLSLDTQATIDALHLAEATYRPAADVTAHLSSKQLIMLVGATCMGKGTVMELVAAQQSTISVVHTITTRPPRPDDADRYTYYEQTDAGVAPLLARIQDHELVQYAVNPYNHHIYASALSDYPGTVCIGDYFSTVVEPYRQFGFQRVLPITVITDPASWQQRFEVRFPPNHKDRLPRLQEAEQSLSWSLDQGVEHHWAINHDSEANSAALQVIDAFEGTSTSNTEAIQLANDCLRRIQELQKS